MLLSGPNCSPTFNISVYNNREKTRNLLQISKKRKSPTSGPFTSIISRRTSIIDKVEATILWIFLQHYFQIYSFVFVLFILFLTELDSHSITDDRLVEA